MTKLTDLPAFAAQMGIPAHALRSKLVRLLQEAGLLPRDAGHRHVDDGELCRHVFVHVEQDKAGKYTYSARPSNGEWRTL